MKHTNIDSNYELKKQQDKIEEANQKIKLAKEVIVQQQKIKREAEDIIADIIGKIAEQENSSSVNFSRHTVPESDSLVQVLLKLEKRYKNNEEELKLARAIIVHSDTFELGKQEFKRVNEEVPENKNKGISKNSKGDTLWKWKAAMDHTKNQTGWKCLTDPEWEEVCNAIPGKSDNEHSRNAIAIFGFSLAGFRDTYGNLRYESREEDVWSSSLDKSNEAFCKYFRRDSNQVDNGSSFQESSRSLRLAKDKISN